jgi:hypothetical protein
MTDNFDQHAYLMRTNAAYREVQQAVTAERTALLVEALAVKAGIWIEEDGKVGGMTAKELKANPRLRGVYPGFEEGEISATVVGPPDVAQPVSASDTFGTVPDPDAPGGGFVALDAHGKETTVAADQGTLVDHTPEQPPTAEPEEESEEKDKSKKDDK